MAHSCEGLSAAQRIFNNLLFANSFMNRVEAAGGGLKGIARRFERNPLIQ